MKSVLATAAVLAALFPCAAFAGNTICKASVQDTHGIAMAWIGTDGKEVVPLKANFVYPRGKIAPMAKGFKIGKAAHLPAGTVFLSAEFGFDVKDGDLKMTVDTVEVDGPTFTRPDSKPSEPMFLLSPGDEAVVREEAVEAEGTLTLRLHPADGKSEKGEIYMLAEERPTLGKILGGAGLVVVAAGDMKGGGIIYQAAIDMPDVATRNTMIASAIKKAAAAAPSGEGCQPAN